MSKPTGYIVHEGTSPLDGSPIVAIITGVKGSANRKTGSMIQSWILRADIDPVSAIKDGSDSAICGSCPHRGIEGKARSCYVNLGQAPLAVYRAYKRGRYPTIGGDALRALLSGRAVRLGSYGDPAFLPESVLEDMTATARNHTGYTHQWNTVYGVHARKYCMASADSLTEAYDAVDKGWRTFVVSEDKVGVTCPASEEAGFKSTCDKCGLCSGLMGRNGKAIGDAVTRIVCIKPHGTGRKHAVARAATLTVGATGG